MTTTNDERKETFYPGVMKRVRFDDFKPLKNAQGFRRVKLVFAIPHNDGQLTGIPDWIAEPLQLVGRVNSGSNSWKGQVEIDGLKLSAFATDQSPSPAFETVSAVANGFAIKRTSSENPKGEVADVELTFSLYTDYSDAVWEWSKVCYGRDFFARFGTAQASFTFGKKAKTTDGEEEGEDADETDPEKLERIRREATSSLQDNLFDPKKVAAEGRGSDDLEQVLQEITGAPDIDRVHEYSDPDDEGICEWCGAAVLADIHNTERFTVGQALPPEDDAAGLTDDDDDLEDDPVQLSAAEEYNETVEVEDEAAGLTDDDEPEVASAGYVENLAAALADMPDADDGVTDDEDESEDDAAWNKLNPANPGGGIAPSSEVEKQEARADVREPVAKLKGKGFGVVQGGKGKADPSVRPKKTAAKRAGRKSK